MDFEKFLENISDKVVLPVLIAVIAGLSYISFSANLKLKEAESNLSFLTSKLREMDHDQSYLGQKIPKALIALVSAKLGNVSETRIKYYTFYFFQCKRVTHVSKRM